MTKPAKLSAQEIAKLRAEVNSAVTATTLEILELCRHVGKPALAGEFVRRRMTIPQVRAALAAQGHAKPADPNEIAAGWAKAIAKVTS